MMGQVLQRLLASIGVDKVVKVTNVVDARRVMLERKFKVVFMDIQVNGHVCLLNSQIQLMGTHRYRKLANKHHPLRRSGERSALNAHHTVVVILCSGG
jgi:hypothetical protein